MSNGRGRRKRPVPRPPARGHPRRRGVADQADFMPGGQFYGPPQGQRQAPEDLRYRGTAHPAQWRVGLTQQGQPTPYGPTGGTADRRMPEPRAGGRPPGMAVPPMRGPMPGPPAPEGGPGAVEDMGQLIGQIVEGFRAYRDSYWPGTQDFATQGQKDLTGENVREAWGEFLDMLRDAFDRFEF